VTSALDLLAGQLRDLVAAGRASEADVGAWVRLVSQGKPLPDDLGPDDADVVQRLAWLMLCHAPSLDQGWLVMAAMRCDLIAAKNSTWDEAFDDIRLLEDLAPYDPGAVERILGLGGDLLRTHVAREIEAVRSGQRRPGPATPGGSGGAGAGATAPSVVRPITGGAARPSGEPAWPASRPPAAKSALFFLPRGVDREGFLLRAAECRLAFRSIAAPGPGAVPEIRFAAADGLSFVLRELPLLDVAAVRVESAAEIEPGHPALVSLGALPCEAFLQATRPPADRESWIHWLGCAALAGPAVPGEAVRERLGAALLGSDAEVRFTAALAVLVGGWPAGRTLVEARLSSERDPRVRRALGQALGRRDDELERALERWRQQPLPVWRGVVPDGDDPPTVPRVTRRDLDRLLWSLDLHLLHWSGPTPATRCEKVWLTVDGRARVRYVEDAALDLRAIQVEGPRAPALGAALAAGLGLVDAAAALRRAREARRSHDAIRALHEIAAVAPAEEDSALVAAVDRLATHPDPEVRLAALLPIARHRLPGFVQPLARLLGDDREPRVREAARLVAAERSSRGAPWPAYAPPPIVPAPDWPAPGPEQVWIVERGQGAGLLLDGLAGHVFRSATRVPGPAEAFSEVTFASRDASTRTAVRVNALLGVVTLAVAGEHADAAVREIGRRVGLLAPAALRPLAQAGPPDVRAWALRALGVTAGPRYNLGVFQIISAALADPFPDVRFAAVDAVAAGAAWRELRPPLERLLRDERDPAVQDATRAALRILARWGGSDPRSR
jgi:hypothetical protein